MRAVPRENDYFVSGARRPSTVDMVRVLFSTYYFACQLPFARTQNVHNKLSRQTLCGNSLYPIKLTVELFLSQECMRAKQPQENRKPKKQNETK